MMAGSSPAADRADQIRRLLEAGDWRSAAPELHAAKANREWEDLGYPTFSAYARAVGCSPGYASQLCTIARAGYERLLGNVREIYEYARA